LTRSREWVYCTLTHIMGASPGNRSYLAVLPALLVALFAPVVRADLPANAAAQGEAAVPGGPIELRGIMATSEGVQFCIYDSAKKKDVWVGLNETGHDFVVKTADPSQDRASVEYQGRILRLDLHSAKVSSSGAAGQPPAPSAIATAQNLGTSPADEQKRLDAVAQEVRRRRLERERAMQPQGAGAPAAPNR
jgi:hypothetical protein